MDKKLGVYVCGGCSIADSVDVPTLVRVAEKEYKVPVCRTHACLCGSEGLAMIRHDLAANAVNSLVIAACSPRVKTDAFTFDPRMVLERVNLREHVVWSHKPNDEDTQMLAEDVLRMGLARAQKVEPLEPVANEVSKTLLVVGGGLTGMTAALEATEANCDVVLVEREDRLGGHLTDVKRTFPTRPPYTDSSDSGLAELTERLRRHPTVRVFTGTTIQRTEGQPGAFDVTLETGGETTRLRVGAIVMATGWRPYDASKLAHLGYGLSPNVVTQLEFERMAVAGQWKRPSDGKPLGRVLFIQCAGSRDPAHLPYCSATCCMETLKQAQYLQSESPGTEVYVIYKDMVTPGQYEKYYQTVQNHPATFFLKGDIQGVELDTAGRVRVKVERTLLGEPIQVAVDLVVLATGMVPNSGDGDAPSDASTGQPGAGTEARRVLNLAYRQGPELPPLRHGFLNSNFVCFPYETQRTGIYAAGAVRAPMDAASAREDARGAVLKAVQCVELTGAGQAVHPRAGDLSFPSFLLQRCTQCKRCTVECPFGAIDEDEKGTPKFNSSRCRRCGICMGACPERTITFKNYSVDIIASMVKAIEVPEEDEEKPRVLLFMCENDAYPALDAAGLDRVQYDPAVRVIPLRCLGSLNIVWIADALSRGIDGVMLMGCKYGDDYQCHFVKGSELANRRMVNVKETLTRLRLEPERLEVNQIAIDEHRKLPAMIDAFMARIREIGPNPYKGF